MLPKAAFVAVAAGVVLSACGGAPNASSSSPAASVCRQLSVQRQQLKLEVSNAPTPGFGLPAGTKPVGIVLDRDGASVWVLGTGSNVVMHVMPSGDTIEYTLPSSGLGLQLSQATDGTVWVPEQYRGAVAAIAPDGSSRECRLPGQSPEVQSTSTAADGSVWVSAGQSIYRLAAGRFTEFPIGVSGASGAEVLADASGGAWFTIHGAPSLGRITPQGDVQLVPIGGSGTNLGLLVAPDGAIWVADFGGDRVVRVAPDRSLTEFKVAAQARPQSLALGPGGVLWLTESGANRIGRIRGAMVEDVIETGRWPDHLAVTQDGWAWFTEYNSDRLGRVRLPA